jgi:hypothetical protein
MPLAIAQAADTIIGMMDIGERLVIPTTRRPNRTLRSPILLRMDQLVSKYKGTAVEDMLTDEEN